MGECGKEQYVFRGTLSVSWFLATLAFAVFLVSLIGKDYVKAPSIRPNYLGDSLIFLTANYAPDFLITAKQREIYVLMSLCLFLNRELRECVMSFCPYVFLTANYANSF